MPKRKADVQKVKPTSEELQAFRRARNHQLHVEVEEYRGKRTWDVKDKLTGWSLLLYSPQEQAVRVGKTRVEVASWQEALALAVRLRDHKEG